VNIRRRALPEGWYPSSKEEILRLLSEWRPGFRSKTGFDSVIGGIVPHAGWDYCGFMIAEVINLLQKNLETVVILGGHNPPGGPIIEYKEDLWDLPFGCLERDINLADTVMEKLPSDISIQNEVSADNTVEVVVPLLGVLLPGVKWAAWRLPADINSIIFGGILAETVKDTGKRIAVIGSTDLTHYGSNFGFIPPESIDTPLVWVEKRDRKILETLAGFDAEKTLALASQEKSACSAGGAVGALTFAKTCGSHDGLILNYTTSNAVSPSSSFVGYGSVIWG